MDVGGGGGQRADVAADQIYRTVLDDDIGFLQLHAAGANRLHFPALEHETGFESLFDEIIVKGFFVVGDAHGGLACVQFSILQGFRHPWRVWKKVCWWRIRPNACSNWWIGSRITPISCPGAVAPS